MLLTCLINQVKQTHGTLTNLNYIETRYLHRAMHDYVFFYDNNYLILLINFKLVNIIKILYILKKHYDLC